jgi:hypothetical protein
LLINLGEVEDKRFELYEPAGRVFKAPGTNLRLIKNVLDKVKRDLGNSPFIFVNLVRPMQNTNPSR